MSHRVKPSQVSSENFQALNDWGEAICEFRIILVQMALLTSIMDHTLVEMKM